MNNCVDKMLADLSSQKLKEFSKKITKSKHEVLGVKIPMLRKLAKQICLNNAEDYLKNSIMQNYEKVLIYGFVIGYSHLSFDVKLDYLKKYIPIISDWSECDSVVATLKFLGKNKADGFKFLLKYFNSNLEFEKRFAIVCFMSYFLTDDYIDEVLKLLVNVKSEFYYVNMAVAWALSVCFVKYYTKTLNYFLNCNLDKFTYNKTIQKCLESFRISNSNKVYLKSIKKV